MISQELDKQEKEYTQKLYYIYMECKTLFIRSEELLSDMGFFVAPTLEHRDALEHIMRYLNLKNNGGCSEEAIKELNRALSHELRAYFDIADFVCISIRKDIANSLKRVSNKKINEVWKEYVDIKRNIVNVSNEIATIRENRKGTVEYVEKYKPIIEKMFSVYNEFLVEIEPKIRRNKIF